MVVLVGVSRHKDWITHEVLNCSNTLQDGPVEHEVKGIVMGANSVEVVRDTYDRSSPANLGELGREGVHRYFADLYSTEPEMIAVVMGNDDWEKVILALEYLGDFSSTALEIESGDLTLIAESIQDVLDGAR